MPLHVLGLPLWCNPLDGLDKSDATKHMPRKIGDRSQIQKHLYLILSVQQNYNKSLNKNLKSLSQAQLPSYECGLNKRCNLPGVGVITGREGFQQVCLEEITSPRISYDQTANPILPKKTPGLTKTCLEVIPCESTKKNITLFLLEF